MCAPNNNEGLTLHQFKQLGNGESVGRGKEGETLTKGMVVSSAISARTPKETRF